MRTAITALAASALILSVAPAALALEGTTELEPDATGDVTISTPGHYVDTDGDSFRTVTIATDGVTLDGLTFTGGAPAAVKNGVAGVSDVAILDSTFSGYTGRTITSGFSEGAGQAAGRATNWTVSGNTIEQGGNAATAIALFDVDGVTVSDNDVTFADGTTGRRGLNLDGVTNAQVTGNSFVMSGLDRPAGSDVAAWGIQVSMSNHEARDITLANNAISGVYSGIIGLSQRDVTSLTVTGNDISAYRAITLNTGSALPLAETLTYTNTSITGNRLDVSGYGIWLRNLHTQEATVMPNSKTVVFDGVTIHGNKVATSADKADAVRIDNTNNVTVLNLRGRR